MATGLYSRRDYNRKHRLDAFSQNNHCPICNKPIQNFSEACANHYPELKKSKKAKFPSYFKKVERFLLAVER